MSAVDRAPRERHRRDERVRIVAGPEIIDIHLHLTRDPQQEKVVFPKKGWPDEWYWANLQNIGAYMTSRGISHVVTRTS